jgi:preprotein translocase subunit SecG
LNARRTEKDLLPISGDLRTEIQDQGVKFVKNSSLNTKLIMAHTDNSLWKLFLWLSVLFFAVEIVLLYLKSKKSSTQSNQI